MTTATKRPTSDELHFGSQTGAAMLAEFHHEQTAARQTLLAEIAELQQQIDDGLPDLDRDIQAKDKAKREVELAYQKTIANAFHARERKRNFLHGRERLISRHRNELVNSADPAIGDFQSEVQKLRDDSLR